MSFVQYHAAAARYSVVARDTAAPEHHLTRIVAIRLPQPLLDLDARLVRGARCFRSRSTRVRDAHGCSRRATDAVYCSETHMAECVQRRSCAVPSAKRPARPIHSRGRPSLRRLTREPWCAPSDARVPGGSSFADGCVGIGQSCEARRAPCHLDLSPGHANSKVGGGAGACRPTLSTAFGVRRLSQLLVPKACASVSRGG